MKKLEQNEEQIHYALTIRIPKLGLTRITSLYSARNVHPPLNYHPKNGYNLKNIYTMYIKKKKNLSQNKNYSFI